MIENSVFWAEKRNYWLYRKQLDINFVDIKKIYKTQLSDLNLVNLFICKSQKSAENVYFKDCLLLR